MPGATRATTPSFGSTRSGRPAPGSCSTGCSGPSTGPEGAALQALKPLLIERTEGNPFFLEESVRALVEAGVLIGERGAYHLVRPAEEIRVLGDGPDRPRRAHRPPGPRGQAAAPDGRRRRQGRPVRAAGRDRLRCGGRPSSGARPAPVGRAALRGDALPGAGADVQACVDPRGDVRRPAPGTAADAPPRSSTRSSDCTPIGWTSMSSAWPTMPCAARPGARPSPTRTQHAGRRWPARPTARRRPGQHALSGLARLPGHPSDPRAAIDLRMGIGPFFQSAGANGPLLEQYVIAETIARAIKTMLGSARSTRS